MTAAATHAEARDRRDLAVAWMNRGYASMLGGDRAGLLSAFDAYQTAIDLLRPLVLPVAVDPSWANSLGAALMNFGHLLHRLHGTQRASDALAVFAEAEQILAPISPATVPWAPRNLAGTRINRANLLLDLQCPTEAAATARRALGAVQLGERRAAIDADLALKARRALCEALGQLLVGAGSAADALATEASDVVDDALGLIRHWRDEQVEFRELALRFFRFGTQLYRLHQPHFLAEFIREHLPVDDAEFRETALATAYQAVEQQSARAPIFTLGDAASERHHRLMRELKSLLAEISTHLPASPASA